VHADLHVDLNFDFTRKVNSFSRYVFLNHIYIQLICGTIENNLSYSKEILSWSRGKKSLSTLLYYTNSYPHTCVLVIETMICTCTYLMLS
jgi:hypothetical protein